MKELRIIVDEREQKMKDGELKIIVDTREKNELWTEDIISHKLDVGDYSFMHNDIDYSNKITIERKSMADAFGTFAGGHKRFSKEIERAKKLDYFAIVIEGSITQCINKDFEGSYNTKMLGYVIFKIINTIHMRYKIPVFFTNNRTESRQLIKSLFSSYIVINELNKTSTAKKT